MNETEHLLTILAEECAEVQVCIAKIQRFGLLDAQPGQEYNNSSRLMQELADVEAVIVMLQDRGIIRLPHSFSEMVRAKKHKVEKFMAFSVQQGTLVLDGA